MLFPLPKLCHGCNTVKSLEEFGDDKYTTDGKATRCILCKRAASAAYRTKHPEKVRAASQRWRVEHPDELQQYVEATRGRKNQQKREHRQAHRDEVNAQSVAYHAAHKDVINRQRRERYQVNKEYHHARGVVYRLNNRAHIRRKSAEYEFANKAARRAYKRLYGKAHPEIARAKAKRRRAARAQAPIIDLTEAQFDEIQAAQKYCCYYCGKRSKDTLTADHILALSQGGSHTVQNVVAACLSCNSRKRTNPPPIPVQPLLLTVAPSRPVQRRHPKEEAS